QRKNIHLVLRFHPSSRAAVEDYFGVEFVKYDQDGFLKVEVTYPEDEWVYGFLLSFGPGLEVIKPPHIREIISERAKKIAEIYQEKIKKF
ncbi:MAG: WYL domain-containing protein, partial [Desulfobacterales bacterium]|nr:WYL domain-containing protein [Desulfobacterales bacterium]